MPCWELATTNSSPELHSRIFTGLPAQPHDAAEFWLRTSSLQMQTLTPIPSGLQVTFLWSQDIRINKHSSTYNRSTICSLPDLMIYSIMPGAWQRLWPQKTSSDILENCIRKKQENLPMIWDQTVEQWPWQRASSLPYPCFLMKRNRGLVPNQSNVDDQEITGPNWNQQTNMNNYSNNFEL